MKHTVSDTLKITLFLVLAVVCFLFLSRIASMPELHVHELESLEAKRSNITRLTAAATGASVAVSMLPGDTATPIAENLADLTDYFLIALCAVYLEKYLITMSGVAAFGVLFPIGFLLLALWVKRKEPKLLYYVKKLMFFGAVLLLIIPSSVLISDTIENTYQFTIEETIESAQDLEDEITAETQASSDTVDEESSASVKEGLLSSLVDGATSIVANAVEQSSSWLHAGEELLNDLMETLAVLLVTSCVIPVVTLLFFLWLVQLFTNVDVPTPYPGTRLGVTKRLLITKKRV